MGIKNVIDSIVKKHEGEGIEVNPPASLEEIIAFEGQVGFSLPADFIEYYTTCDGFACNKDIFKIIPLSGKRHHQQDHGRNWFYFAEYMIYSDTWGLRFTDDGRYEIFNGSYPTIAMTSSLEEFLSRFLKGNVFESGGLYEWHDELKINSAY